jgi:hypothetical protein
MSGTYYPILRPRRGEMAALHHLDPAAAERVLPIIELAGERLIPLVKALPPRVPAIVLDLADRDIPPLLLAAELADLDVAMIVAAGAMPANLDELPTDQAVTVGRLDARVWERLAQPGVAYADHGVTSPVRRLGVQHHRQLPTLRYTSGPDWWIYRWARRERRGDDRCHDLCRTLVHSAQWPAVGARFSWGDAEIARRARTARGDGSPAGWIGWSTSHHIAHVLRTLPEE